MEIRPVFPGGAAMALGGNTSVEAMLDPYGGSPYVPNTMHPETYGTDWLMQRIGQLVALFDNPYYSFLEGVTAMTNQETRTTTAFGERAVLELFAVHHDVDASVRGRFWARMPFTMNDKEREEAKDSGVPPDSEYLRPAKRDGYRAPTVSSDYPTVGHIGPRQFGQGGQGGQGVAPALVMPSMGTGTVPAATIPAIPAATMPATPVVPVAPSPVAVQASAAVHNLSTHGSTHAVPLPPPNTTASQLAQTGVDLRASPQDVEAIATAVVARMRLSPNDPKAVEVPIERNATLMGKGDKIFEGLENGERPLLLRLLDGPPMSDADLDGWRTIYKPDAVGQRGNPCQLPEKTRATRRGQLAQMEEYAQTIRDRNELHWKTLPENLRYLFVTPRARMALEHAAWFVQFQQPWDPNLPAPRQLPAITFAHNRQTVPVIDLITHTQTRVPFQSLVALILMYWQNFRTANRDKQAEIMSQINSVMLTMRAVRQDTNGFITVAGHYDVEAQRSRWERASQSMETYQVRGAFPSDMDQIFYSQSQGPVPSGRHTARVLDGFRRRIEQTREEGSARQRQLLAAMIQ